VKRIRKAFISYRRDDAAHPAGRIREWFVQSWRIPQDSVFMDVANILPGADFEAEIQEAIAQCEAMIILISPSWLSNVNQPSISYPRLEAEAGLNAKLRVIPVLVDRMSLPTKEQLPPSLHPLLKLNILPLRADSFDYDIGLVGKALGLRTRRPAAIAAVIAVLIVATSLVTLSQVPKGNPVWSLVHGKPPTSPSTSPSTGPPTLPSSTTRPPATCSSVLGPTSSPASVVSPFADVAMPDGSVALSLHKLAGDSVTFTVNTTTVCSPGFNLDSIRTFFTNELGNSGWAVSTGRLPDDGYLGHNCADIALACWANPKASNGPTRMVSLAKPVVQPDGLLTYEMGFYDPPTPPSDIVQCGRTADPTFHGADGLTTRFSDDPSQVPIPWYSRSVGSYVHVVFDGPEASSYMLVDRCGPGNAATLRAFFDGQLPKYGWVKGTYTLPNAAVKCSDGTSSVDGWIAPSKNYGIAITKTTDLAPVGVVWTMEACGTIFK
jgi:hypothetical protein